MSVVYTTRWRLVYLDGRMLDELPQGSTIRERWAEPIELHLMDLTGQSVMRIPLPKGAKPIFYRRRSLGADPLTGKMDATPSLDATVFGYGKEVGSNGQCKLWMWSRGKAIDCPQEMIDQNAIESLLTA